MVSVRLSVRPSVLKRNQPSFINISLTVVIILLLHQWKCLLNYYSMETQYFYFIFIIVQNWILTCTEKLKSPKIFQYQSYFILIHEWNGYWYMNEFWLVLKSWNPPRFFNISLTSYWYMNGMDTWMEIDTWMERFSRVLQHGNRKIWISFQKKFEIEFWLVVWLVLKNWNHIILVLQYYSMASQKFDFLKKITCLPWCFCCYVL